MNRSRAIPEMSQNTRTLVRMLEQVPVGEVLEHAEMTAAIGLDTQREGYHNLRSACLIVLRTSQLVFSPVVNVGVKRLDDCAKVADGKRRAGMMRRQAKRALRVLAAVDNFAALPPETRTEHNVLMAQFGALRAMTTAPAAKRIAEKVGTEQQEKFSPAQSLELIEGSV